MKKTKPRVYRTCMGFWMVITWRDGQPHKIPFLTWTEALGYANMLARWGTS